MANQGLKLPAFLLGHEQKLEAKLLLPYAHLMEIGLAIYCICCIQHQSTKVLICEVTAMQTDSSSHYT